MLAFVLTILIALPQAPVARKYTVQSQAVYKNRQECEAGINQIVHLITAGLPQGTQVRIGGSCVAPQTIQG